jgi:acylglycerol lipase
MERSEGTFNTPDGLSLYYQRWLPEGSPAAVVVIVHGLADHGGRYAHVGAFLAAAGYAVYALDQRGHGRSDGKRCYADRFSDHVDDLAFFLDRVRDEQGGRKTFLLGHSMGGTIVLDYALTHRHGLAGILVSSALIRLGAASATPLAPLAGLLSAVLPRVGTTVIDAAAISRDAAVVESYRHDPLVFCGKIPAREGAEALKAARRIEAGIGTIDVPMLILQGTADRIVDPAGSRRLYEKAGAADKTLKLYDGFYHEIMNDPGQQAVLKDIKDWLAARV